MSTLDWAKREIELACKQENPERKPGEFEMTDICNFIKDYGITTDELLESMEHIPFEPVSDIDIFLIEMNPGLNWFQKFILKHKIRKTLKRRVYNL